MRGRKPLPASFKVITGEKRAARLGGETVAITGAVEPPAHLSEAARQEWDRLAPELIRAGLLTPLDTMLFAAYCQTAARLVEAERLLDAAGFTAKTAKGGTKPHPLVGIVHAMSGMLHRLSCELCLTPASRNRVKVNRKADGAAARWAE